MASPPAFMRLLYGLKISDLGPFGAPVVVHWHSGNCRRLMILKGTLAGSLLSPRELPRIRQWKFIGSFSSLIVPLLFHIEEPDASVGLRSNFL